MIQIRCGEEGSGLISTIRKVTLPTQKQSWRGAAFSFSLLGLESPQLLWGWEYPLPTSGGNMAISQNSIRGRTELVVGGPVCVF